MSEMIHDFGCSNFTLPLGGSDAKRPGRGDDLGGNNEQSNLRDRPSQREGERLSSNVKTHKANKRRGFSLLEVMLALAITGLSLAAISELISLGSRAALRSRDITTAQFLAESKLNEFSAGVGLAGPVSRQIFIENPDWVYSVDMLPIDDSGLVQLMVLVERSEESNINNPLKFQVVRWIPDPTLGLNQPQQDPYLDSVDANPNATGGDSTTTGGSPTGGASTTPNPTGGAPTGGATPPTSTTPLPFGS